MQKIYAYLIKCKDNNIYMRKMVISFTEGGFNLLEHSLFTLRQDLALLFVNQ